jgi:short-subunit dehydrogenase
MEADIMNVLITGASGGLGRALACECARRGWRLFLTDLNANGLEALKCGLEREYGTTVVARACDLTNAEDVGEMLRLIDERGLRFDMLLNVAGGDYEGGLLTRPCENLLRIVSLNIEATLRITHGVLERRVPGRRFNVVFVSSLASKYPMPLKATYAASKRFLLDFSIALGQELKSQNVRVTALCPAGLATTPEAIRGISAQGIWGSLTTNKLESVAQGTINRALSGRRIYIPGILNRTLSAAGSVVPQTFVAKVIYSRWRAAQRKWLDPGAKAV